MRNFLLPIVFFTLLFSLSFNFSFAHVKWFVDEFHHPDVDYDDSFRGVFLSIWLLIALFAVFVCYLIEKHFSFPKEWEYKIRSKKHIIVSIFSIILGLFLIIASFDGFVLSHNIKHIGPLHESILFLQAFLGLMLVIGVYVRLMAFLFIIFGSLLILQNPISAIEAIWALGAGIFLLIYGRPKFALTKQKGLINQAILKNEVYAIPVLRFFTGLNLLILGFSEKLLNPNLGILFLREYHWNFMYNLGLKWYSDYFFVLSAGAVEAILGLLLILGMATRFVASIIAFIFMIPIFILGPFELIGHMPHFAIILLLILFGSGEKIKIHTKKYNNS